MKPKVSIKNRRGGVKAHHTIARPSPSEPVKQRIGLFAPHIALQSVALQPHLAGSNFLIIFNLI